MVFFFFLILLMLFPIIFVLTLIRRWLFFSLNLISDIILVVRWWSWQPSCREAVIHSGLLSILYLIWIVFWQRGFVFFIIALINVCLCLLLLFIGWKHFSHLCLHLLSSRGCIEVNLLLLLLTVNRFDCTEWHSCSSGSFLFLVLEAFATFCDWGSLNFG